MDLQHLRAFLTVARELSFTQAAKDLHCSQSTVTAQIQKLEAGLGTELFRRRGCRPVELTAAGLLLQDRAERILWMVDATDHEIRMTSRDPSPARLGQSAAGPGRLRPTPQESAAGAAWGRPGA